MTLDAAITAAMGYIASITGIKSAPTEPPEDNPGLWPFVVGYPGVGRIKHGEPAGVMTGLHDIVIEFHVGRMNLPFDYEAAVPYIESIPNALIKNLETNKWGNTISTFEDISYRFGPMEWGTAKTIGWRFTVEQVKLQTAVA